MKKGLILEGGAMRGMFSAGVLDVFMEEGINFDAMVGVSAGAVFGCNFKSKQIGRTIRYNTKYIKDPRYCSLRSLIKTGDMFGKDFCYNEIPNKLDPFDNSAFTSNPIKYYVVATDVNTGLPVYKRIDTADEAGLEWMRASASMPLASTIVKVDGLELLDGGISDSVPLEFFEDLGFKKNVIILTQPEGYVKKKNSLLPIIRLALRKYPRLVNALKNRHIMYNKQTDYVAKREKEGGAFIIRPEASLPIGRMEKDPKVLKATYEIGRATALKQLEMLKKYLS